MTLSEAFHYCLQFNNATLLSIHANVTNGLIRNITKSNSTLWLGGQVEKYGTAEVYRWLDGSRFDFSMLARGRQYCREKRCAIYFDLDGSWEGCDFDDSINHNAACLQSNTEQNSSLSRHNYYKYVNKFSAMLSMYPLVIHVDDNPEISSLIQELKDELLDSQKVLTEQSSKSFANKFDSIKFETELAGFGQKFFVIGLLVMVLVNFLWVLVLCVKFRKLRKRLGFYGSSW